MPDYQVAQTLNQLQLVEGERDRWQRPDDVIESLNLQDGDTVSGSGLRSRILLSKACAQGRRARQRPGGGHSR